MTNEQTDPDGTLAEVSTPAAHMVYMPELLTSTELVDYLRLPSLDALYSMRNRGDGPPAVKVQRQLLFRHDAVVAWLDSRTES